MKKSIFIVMVVSLFSLPTFGQFSTNLPIIKLTINQAIVDSYRQATLEVIDNTSGVNTPTDAATFTSNAGVKLRGNVTVQLYPKKSYSVETWLGFNESNNVSVLGLPAENDWVLLAAYPDRSLLRSKLALELHDEMDRYAPRMKYCELFIDTSYQGIYLFGEKIKRDSSRLDLKNLRIIDNFGDQLTGGYILNVDDENGGGFTSSFPPPNAASGQQVKFLYEYPDNGVITPAQKAYIASYVDSFEVALNGPNYQDSVLGWRPYAADNALLDYMIVNEVTKNYDAYRRDMYLYKDKLKQLRPGPLWGGDNSFANTTKCAMNGISGFAFDVATNCGTEAKLPSFWWNKLMTDVEFVKALKCRYTRYRYAGDVLDTTHIFFLIDSFSSLINQTGAVGRNFTKYPIFGTQIFSEPLPMSANYAEEITKIKTFISARIAWLDGQWLDPTCIPLSVNEHSSVNEISIYPNPSHGSLNVKSSSTSAIYYELKTLTGGVILNGKESSGGFQMSLSHLTPGIYILLIDQDEQRYMKKVTVE